MDVHVFDVVDDVATVAGMLMEVVDEGVGVVVEEVVQGNMKMGSKLILQCLEVVLHRLWDKLVLVRDQREM
jgi:hypothetical protein